MTIVALTVPCVAVLIAVTKPVSVFAPGGGEMLLYCWPFAISVNEPDGLMFWIFGSITVAVLAALDREPGSTT